MTAILTGLTWSLSVVWICISFMPRDGEHFFTCFFGYLDFFFEKVLFQLPTSFLVHWFGESLVFNELPVYSGYQSFDK
jgi:hypothetical protein